MKNSLIFLFASSLFIYSNILLASKDQDDARAEVKGSYVDLYKNPEPKQPSNNWQIYFGPSASDANTSAVAAKKRKIIESFGVELDKGIIEKRKVKLRVIDEMNKKLYEEYGYIPEDSNSSSDTSSDGSDESGSGEESTGLDFGY